MRTIVLEKTLDAQAVAAVAHGASLRLSDAAWNRVDTAAAIVAALVENGTWAYGITTGVGALADTVVDRQQQARLSRNIIMSHAAGVGPLLPREEVRAMIAAQINNLAHGHSGVRPQILHTYLAFLDQDCIPDVPSRGSAGYLSHMAHIALVLIGAGTAHVRGVAMTGAEAMAAIGMPPVVLGAKEGLSLVNGNACSMGLGALALARAARLFDWADATACLTLEALGAQMNAFDEPVLALRRSPGLNAVGATLRARLAGSGLLAAARGARTQDALSLRAIPHVHGAARDVLAAIATVVDRELASVTDNPAVSGTPEAPLVSSEAHAVSAAMGQAMDSLAVAVAQIGGISERRLDRLVNPLVSGLPAFLATDPGVGSGFMIAHYTAATLAADCRRLASPASLDGGITSALQEDFLAHPTGAALKLLAIIDIAEQMLGIELMAAAQAQDIVAPQGTRAAGTDVLQARVRELVPLYEDDRPLSVDLARMQGLVHDEAPPAIPG